LGTPNSQSSAFAQFGSAEEHKNSTSPRKNS